MMKKYECGLTEGDEEKGWTCPLDNPYEIVKDCKDCCFAIEVEERNE